MDKKIVVIIDPRTKKSETIELNAVAVDTARVLDSLYNTRPQDRAIGDLKQDILIFLTSCLRPEVIEFASSMESKLRCHDQDRGNSWREMSYTECFTRLEGELRELKEAIMSEEDVIKVLGEGADVGNFGMFITHNYKQKHAE